MNFFESLLSDTAAEREKLLSVPLIQNSLDGEIDIPTYIAFLEQAYHHVRHTTPLLMLAGSKIPTDQPSLQSAFAEYVAEEIGHDQWILNDISACGHDANAVVNDLPNPETELFVAYAYDIINRVSPLGLFGMVLVLEGTSTTVATRAADAVQKVTGLPDNAFSYLRSHGELDQAHMQFFEGLMNGIVNRTDQAIITHSARMFYRLYRDLLGAVAAMPAPGARAA